MATPRKRVKKSTATAKPAAKKSSAKKPAAKKPAAKKGSDDTKAAAKAKAAEARKAAQAEKAEAKKAARVEAISKGDIIEGKGGVEFHRTEPTTGTMIERAETLLTEIKKSATPIATRDLIDKFGGQHPQYLAMFSLLEAQGEVVKYRQRGGDSGASQVAFLHVSQMDQFDA